MRTIEYGGECWKLHADGRIERPGLVAPSGSWRVLGAVRFNNFGAVAERFTLQEVLTVPIRWHHKNGKQRVHVVDWDHGTRRVWMCPRHRVY